MAGLIITRQRLIAFAVAVALALAGAVWFYDTDRQLRRVWEDLLDSVEMRNTTRLGRVVAEGYHDRWGYTRRSILDDARLAFFQFRRLELTADQIRFERTEDAATISAILKFDAEGSGQVAEARVTLNALFTPFLFTWRREPGITGGWKLVTFDHPELDLRKFRARW